jgi:hypothetical protein
MESEVRTRGSAAVQDGGAIGITRIAKACELLPSRHCRDLISGEPCRTRKTRCDIATQAVCSECLKRDQAGACTIREKARPSR